MLDNYVIFSILARTIALVPLIIVLERHIKLMGGTAYRSTKIALLAIFIFVIFNNAFSIFVNLYRGADGNLLTGMRHINMVVNAIAALGQACGWFLLYIDDEE